MIRRLIARNWKPVLIALLIVAMLLFAPDLERKFIYTEF